MPRLKSSNLARAIDQIESGLNKLKEFNNDDFADILADAERYRTLAPEIQKIAEKISPAETPAETPADTPTTRRRRVKDKLTNAKSDDTTSEEPEPEQPDEKPRERTDLESEDHSEQG